ncbi:outer membrane protein assembly factor BamB [Sphingomonas kaistensis]|uniref:Outer membrane protein assembly factor BamB n=1 Tax=Sphingomonas kaistensis TaxID=298708 RepID=A0A7X6BEJ1_9SPHN|nr:PQQ-binding-like beta-propeller repeat protein [Sphingomonas kaistensis]NJC04329.1 outer membrane protein assembly factor BamB [Sphingomonas kaistensis]
MIRKVVTLALAASMLAGCGIVGKSRPKTPVVGNRVSVLSTDPDVQVDSATAALPFSIPAPEANPNWNQPGGTPSKSAGHPALGASLAEAWNVSIGQGSTVDAGLAAPPVVAGGTVYTIDTSATVRAFDTATGGQRWAAQFGTERGNNASLFGGGVAVEGDRVFATNGLGFVAALNAATGAPVWQVRPGGPLRGAPTVAGDTLYVMSQDNQLYSLKTADGATNWSATAAVEIAGVFGTAAPAFERGTVVAGFSSGELNAYRFENGRLVWQDALARTSISTSVATLSDIDASPVIDNGQVFALGQGGRMVALDLISGQRIWELNLAGIATPWIAGDWLFAVTDEGKAMAISRNNGKIRWINQLPAFENPKGKRGPISYVGPVLAGGRLILGGSNGVLVNLDPATGAFQSQTNVGAAISQSPVVANNTLYVLDDKGRLHAYR